MTHDDYLHEDTRKRIKKFNEKLEECLDNTNFILKGENGINLKFLEDPMLLWQMEITYQWMRNMVTC
jgi:hypothetical protein